MAPFVILEAGFSNAAWLFGAHLFGFGSRGPDFGTLETTFGPGIWKMGSGWPGEVWK